MTVPEKLVRDYEYAKGIYGEQILGVFLYGSQNYGIATEESDVDVKAIYIPTLREVAANNPLISEELKISDEHIEVKDIRLMSQMWKKGSINFLEILFTDYFVINPLYCEDWEKVLRIRNLITEKTKDKTLAAGKRKVNEVLDIQLDRWVSDVLIYSFTGKRREE